MTVPLHFGQGFGPELTVAAEDVSCRRATVADRDDCIQGFATLEGEPPTGALMMFVEPQVIGQEIGRLLFKHTIANGRGLGFTQLTIDADPNAEPFYRAMGPIRLGNVALASLPAGCCPRWLSPSSAETASLGNLIGKPPA